ncbi:hypothetical protein EVAR_76848_1 [Eumeta japonica]|uniref:Uncharacterized protein n=1 Tax=Eumeta variegata TaxID=151549 RepID=A0A4C1SHD9_EUMVA|nr:hypothetical protein EVAR_76848_1 [Eumeta japonica]
MPRRLPPDVVHSARHAPSALACAVRPHSVKLSKSSDLSSDSSRPTQLLYFQEEFFSGFQSHTTHAYGREGVQDRHFYLLLAARGKQKKKKAGGCTTYTDDASAIARRAQAAHGTFPERGPGTNSLPYMVRRAGRCSEGSYDVIGSQ